LPFAHPDRLAFKSNICYQSAFLVETNES